VSSSGAADIATSTVYQCVFPVSHERIGDLESHCTVFEACHRTKHSSGLDRDFERKSRAMKPPRWRSSWLYLDSLAEDYLDS
jgi:antibiotic biosynthesis monooxygenase (ABM) superfamily enzyme